MNGNRKETEALLTTKEVADEWRTCTKTIRRLVDRDVLHPVRISARCIRFRASDVAAAVARMSGERVTS